MKKVFLILISLVILLSAAGCAKEPAAEITEDQEETENFFIGTWYQDGDMSKMSMELLSDGSWTLYDALQPEEDTPEILAAGTAKMKRDELKIYCDAVVAATAGLNDDSTMTIVPEEGGGWYLDEEICMYREEVSWMPETEPETAAPDFDAFIGLWKYDGWKEWLEIRGDGTWDRLDAFEAVMESGTVIAHEDSIVLTSEDTNLELFIRDADTLTDSIGSQLLRVEQISVPPFFDDHGLYPNIEAGEGLRVIENGAHYYLKDGSAYLKGKAFWEIEVLDSYINENDCKDVTFQARSYLTGDVGSQLPGSKYKFGTGSGLYDRYSGASLPAKKTTEGEENSYSCTIEANGQTYEIFYTITTVWDKNDPDWDYVLYKTIHLTYPEDYDGLLFCMRETSDTYEDYKNIPHHDVPEVIGEDEIERIRGGLIYSIG